MASRRLKLRRIKGCITGTTGEYEWEAEWTGREVHEPGDRDTPDLFVAIVDKVDVVACCIKSSGDEDGQFIAFTPEEVQEAAEDEAGNSADEGIYSYI